MGRRPPVRLALASAAFAVACDISEPAPRAPLPNVTDSQVTGTWRSACSAAGDGSSTRAINEFGTDGGIDVVTASFLDPNCVLISFELIRRGRYVEHTQVTGPDGTARVSLDQVFDANLVRPRGPGAADVFNDVRACGFDDWATDVATDIGDCVNDTGQPLVFIGIELPFEQYTVAREDRGRLFFGDEVSFTAWNRPTELATQVALIRASGADGDDFPAPLLGFWRDPARRFDGTEVSSSYVSLGENGRITFLDLVPEAGCVGEVPFTLFESDAPGSYRDAFEQLFFTLSGDGDVLEVGFGNVASSATYERETAVVPEDLPLCSAIAG